MSVAHVKWPVVLVQVVVLCIVCQSRRYISKVLRCSDASLQARYDFALWYHDHKSCLTSGQIM